MSAPEERQDDRVPGPATRSLRAARPIGAFRVALVYGIAGTLWILFSDLALEALVRDPVRRDALQHWKGAAYVAATSLLLWALLAHHRSRLVARDRRLRAVLDGMVDAVLVADRAGRIVDLNAAAAALTGLDAERPVPLVHYAREAHLRHPDGRPLPPGETATARALQGETVQGFEALMRRPDGRDVFVSVSAAPLLDAAGAPELAVVVMRDISEVKRFEEMREEFLATAAHELKTPLAVVKAYAQLMLRREQGEPAALAAIARQVDRLNRIVQQLLDVSRFRVGGGDLRRERFDLGALAAEVAERLRTTGGGRLVVAREGPAPVEADRDRIAQVVTNLLENAVRFSPRGGPVETRVAPAGGDAVLSVRDEGVGIPAERQARVFERFYRAHAGTAEDYGGLGLGLDVAREIVARHGGRIWFESEAGQGSTFSFSLPLAREERA